MKSLEDVGITQDFRNWKLEDYFHSNNIHVLQRVSIKLVLKVHAAKVFNV